MTRLIAAELRKAWQSKVFFIALAALLCANVFLLWVDTKPSSGAYTSHAYNTMNAALNGKSMEEKAQFIHTEFTRTEALNMIDGVLRTEAYDGGKHNVQLREKYAAEFDEYYDVYAAKSYLVYTDNLADEYRFLNKIQLEFDTVYGYDAFLDSIAEKATQLSSISIFAESADGYDMANITATAKAYEKMRGTAIDYAPQMGLYTALDFSLTDVISVFAMLLIATVLVRGERDNGLLNLIRATPAGRLKTAAAKLFALAISLLAVLLLLYGVNLLYCGAAYGLGGFGRSIQSVPALMRSTLKLNVGQYLGLFLLTKWAAALVSGVWVMLTMLVAKRAFSGYIGALSMLGANLLIRNIIPATSKLNVIKYANLVSLLRTNELIGGYRNLYWFGSPVSLWLVEAVTGGCLAVLFIALFCRVFAHAQLKTAGHGFALKRKKAARCKPTTVLRQEAYKLFFMNGAAVILALFCGFQVYTAVTTESYIDADEIYYRYYMKNIEGAVTQEKIDWLMTEREEFMPIYKLQSALAANRISSQEYQSMMMGYSSLQQKMGVFERVMAKFEYFKEHPRSQFVYESGYLKLFDTSDKSDAVDALIAALLCAVCFSGLFSMERQTGMEKVISATPLGRDATVKCKLKVCSAACVIITFLSVLPRFWVVMRDYGLGAFFAPSYSMTQFDGIIDIPMFFMLFLFVAARYIAIKMMAMFTMGVSYRFGNLFSALFIASACTGIPLLLSISGLTAAKWVSVYPLFHAAAMFATPAEAFAAIFAILICAALSFIYMEYLKTSFGTVHGK